MNLFKKLDEIEAAAKGATPWDSNDHSPATPEWLANKENNTNYLRKCSPATILQLTQALRTAVDALGWISSDPSRSLWNGKMKAHEALASISALYAEGGKE